MPINTGYNEWVAAEFAGHLLQTLIEVTKHDSPRPNGNTHVKAGKVKPAPGQIDQKKTSVP